MKINLLLSLLGVAFLMTACGGGGSDNNSPKDSAYVTPHPKPLSVSEQDRQAFERTKVIEYPAYLLSALSSRYSQDFKVNDQTVISLGRLPISRNVKINAHPLASGWREYQATVEKKNRFDEVIETGTATLRSYQGFHSGVILLNPHEDMSVYMFPYGNVHYSFNKLPSSGKARYQGVAFDYADTGELTLEVDFGRKKSYGVITGLEAYGPIMLQEANLALIDYNIPASGIASMPAIQRTGKYVVLFAGSEAQEALGNVNNSEEGIVVAFHGARGKIEK